MTSTPPLDRPILAQVLSGLHMTEAISVPRWVTLEAVQRTLRLRGDKLAAVAAPAAIGRLVLDGKVESMDRGGVPVYRRALTRE